MAKQDELVFGIHAVNELIKRAPERFIELFLLKGREDERVAHDHYRAKNTQESMQPLEKPYLREGPD